MAKKQPVDEEAAPGRALAARLRKLELEMAGAIHCGRCPYHRKENRTHRSPHADPRKTRRRARKQTQRIVGKR